MATAVFNSVRQHTDGCGVLLLPSSHTDYQGKMMQCSDMMSAAQAPKSFSGRALAEGQGLPGEYAQDTQRNQQFVSLLNAFRRSGGLARAPEVAARHRTYGGNDVSPLAGWINKRQLISFEWHSLRWMPLFQFNPVGLTLRAGLGDILAELRGVYDDWELANWFAQPNPWLADCTPADTLAVAAPQVLNAARFIEVG